MKRLLLTAALTLPLIAHGANDYAQAVSRHAQATAHEMVSQWVTERSNGRTWNQILRTQVPTMLDSVCGYRALIGLPEVGFNQAKKETEPVVGTLLETAFGPLLSRQDAKLALEAVTPMLKDNADQVMITLKVTPTKPRDPSLNLLFQLTAGGDMVLCDMATSPKVKDGILYNLGVDLDL